MASALAVVLWVMLFLLLLATALAGFRASYVILVLLGAYVVMFQLGARVRKR